MRRNGDAITPQGPNDEIAANRKRSKRHARSIVVRVNPTLARAVLPPLSHPAKHACRDVEWICGYPQHATIEIHWSRMRSTYAACSPGSPKAEVRRLLER